MWDELLNGDGRRSIDRVRKRDRKYVVCGDCGMPGSYVRSRRELERRTEGVISWLGTGESGITKIVVEREMKDCHDGHPRYRFLYTAICGFAAG